MSLESLERKHKALATVMERYRAFTEALAELPSAWIPEVLAELGATPTEHAAPTQSLGPTEDAAAPIPSQTADIKESMSPEEDAGDDSPGANEAILDLLSRHPEGLPPAEIASELAGRIKTKSAQPKKLLYSAMIGMRRRGKLVQTTDGRYRVKSLTQRDESRLNFDQHITSESHNSN